MTNREAYVFGWVFGRINAEVFPDDIGPDPWEACMRPYTCSAQVISAAHEKGLLSGDLDQQIGEALSEINSIEPEMDGGSEKAQPLEIQGSWQLGYYAGKGGKPPASSQGPRCRSAPWQHGQMRPLRERIHCAIRPAEILPGLRL